MIKNLKMNYELLLITLVAFTIRLINLGKLNLWLDEGYSVGYVYRGLSFIFRDSFSKEPNPPLYNFLLNFWIKTFGESEFSIRFPSAVFGALSISLVYLIGKKYVSGRIGTLAAILIIGNPFYLTYSQEARVYTLFTFLCLCSVYYFPANLEWKDKKKYFLVTWLVPWAHAYGVFLLLAQNIYILTKFFLNKCEKEFIKTWLIIQGLIFSVAALWYVPFLIHRERYARRMLWIKPITLQEFFEMLKGYIGEQTYLFEVLILMSLATAIFMLIKKRDMKSRGVFVLFLWLLFTIVIPLIAGSFWHPFLMARYTIAASMIFVIIALAPMDLFLKESKKLYLSFLLLAALFNAWEVDNFFKTTKKQEWVKVIETILLDDKSQAPVVIQEYFEGSSLEYYMRRMGLEKRINVYYLDDFNQLKNVLKDKGHAWFIHAGNPNPQGFNNDHDFLEESFSNTNDRLQLIKLKAQQTYSGVL
jgi:hypothetical protein